MRTSMLRAVSNAIANRHGQYEDVSEEEIAGLMEAYLQVYHEHFLAPKKVYYGTMWDEDERVNDGYFGPG